MTAGTPAVTAGTRAVTAVTVHYGMPRGSRTLPRGSRPGSIPGGSGRERERDMGRECTMGGDTRAVRRGTAILASVALAASISVAAVGAPAGAAVLGTASTAVLGKANNAGTLTVQAPGVTVLKKGNKSFVKGKSKQKIKTGDTVQTDGTGFAEITFADGSITRLDNNTVFTLDRVTTKTGARQVEGTVSAGQTWNRVQTLSTGDSFEQKGNDATAAVLGTAFVTKCQFPSGGVAFKVVKTKKALRKLRKATKNCNFTLIDGKLALTALNGVVNVNRGQQIAVATGGQASDVETYPPDILFTDQWIVRNLGSDSDAGIAEASGEPTADDLKQARIEGAWPVQLTVTAGTGFRNLGPRSRTYTFSGSGNQVTLSRETANGTRVIPLTYVDGLYSGVDPDLGVQDCVLDDGTVSVPNGLQNSGTITFSPSAAVPTNGLWRATGLVGTVTETATQVAGRADQCLTGTATFGLVANR